MAHVPWHVLAVLVNQHLNDVMYKNTRSVLLDQTSLSACSTGFCFNSQKMPLGKSQVGHVVCLPLAQGNLLLLLNLEASI